MTAKKKASDSLARLRSGIVRETPATRAREEEASSNGVPANTTGDKATQAPAPARSAPATPRKTPETPKKRGRPARSKPERLVRVSVDVPRSRHKFLRDFAYDAETDGMSVMRALLEELERDEKLAARISKRLVEERLRRQARSGRQR